MVNTEEISDSASNEETKPLEESNPINDNSKANEDQSNQITTSDKDQNDCNPDIDVIFDKLEAGIKKTTEALYLYNKQIAKKIELKDTYHLEKENKYLRNRIQNLEEKCRTLEQQTEYSKSIEQNRNNIDIVSAFTYISEYMAKVSDESQNQTNLENIKNNLNNETKWLINKLACLNIKITYKVNIKENSNLCLSYAAPKLTGDRDLDNTISRIYRFGCQFPPDSGYNAITPTIEFYKYDKTKNKNRIKSIIKFDGNGAEGSMKCIETFSEEEIQPPECTYTPPKYCEFKGWSLSKDGELASWPYFVPEYEEIIFYAIWKKIELKYEIEYIKKNSLEPRNVINKKGIAGEKYTEYPTPILGYRPEKRRQTFILSTRSRHVKFYYNEIKLKIDTNKKLSIEKDDQGNYECVKLKNYEKESITLATFDNLRGISELKMDFEYKGKLDRAQLDIFLVNEMSPCYTRDNGINEYVPNSFKIETNNFCITLNKFLKIKKGVTLQCKGYNLIDFDPETKKTHFTVEYEIINNSEQKN